MAPLSRHPGETLERWSGRCRQAWEDGDEERERRLARQDAEAFAAQEEARDVRWQHLSAEDLRALGKEYRDRTSSS